MRNIAVRRVLVALLLASFLTSLSLPAAHAQFGFRGGMGRTAAGLTFGRSRAGGFSRSVGGRTGSGVMRGVPGRAGGMKGTGLQTPKGLKPPKSTSVIGRKGPMRASR